MKRILPALLTFVVLVASATHAAPLVYEGTEGPGKGRHIVFLAGDQEFRSEESLPLLARILAKHHGFKCTVLFNLDDQGDIVAGDRSNMPGMEALGTADLAVIFLRLQNFPEEQMKHFDAYLKRGGPVVGLRPSTHAFNIAPGSPFAKYSYNYKGTEYPLGFGHQVLGQTWLGQHGISHSQSTRLVPVAGMHQHPILRGVRDIWVQGGACMGKPVNGEILTMAQPLNGMSPDSLADATKAPMASEWTRYYLPATGIAARVFTSLNGSSEDITNDGYRRLLINGCFWALGMEDVIKPNMNIALSGAAWPNTFGTGMHARGIKPEMYAGFESFIPAINNAMTPVAAKTATATREDKSATAMPASVAAGTGTAAAAVAKAAPPTLTAAGTTPASTPASTKLARYIRIELPGAKRTLTLAEVEVMVRGQNVAPSGRTSQSTTNQGGVPERAIDGNKSSDWAKRGQTHTKENMPDPWWELDLGREVDIEKVGIWNRKGFARRLNGFTMRLLDASRREVFVATNIAAPEAMTIDIRNSGALTYLTHEGGPGVPVP